MSKKIKKMYIVHHSHTDIGYTDLQERIIFRHIEYIRSAIRILKEDMAAENGGSGFRWNCESYFCVEQFLKEAGEQEKEDFFELCRLGKMGISANYLNFNDLVDCEILNRRTGEMTELFAKHGVTVKTAMNADINGISMGQRDVYLNNGVEFLFTNIHTHHGMYPLYHNQCAYWWEDDQGRRLLVFNGEHYNLGNALGLKPNADANFMMRTMYGESAEKGALGVLTANVDKTLDEYEENSYPYDFLITSVSGVFSDNAPPNTEISRMVEAYNAVPGHRVEMQMVSLRELYDRIRDELGELLVFHGDLNDWWAGGVGSTPYVVKHYKEAQRNYHLLSNLSRRAGIEAQDYLRTAEDNLLLYAEHTWGHSSTITNPYDTMVMNLDIRKNSYASKAHEAAAAGLCRVLHGMGDSLDYYAAEGRIKAVNPTDQKRTGPVEFYVEILPKNHVILTDEATGKVIEAQIGPNPRGVTVTFVDTFAPGEEKYYRYQVSTQEPKPACTRVAHVGAERVRDIINSHDKESYLLPYGLENGFFRIKYEIGKGITSFYLKEEKKELLKDGYAQIFTPLYENTRIREDIYEERRLLGRNIRGHHARLNKAELTDVKILEQGPVYWQIELVYALEGTCHSSVVLKMYRDLARIDFKYKIGKTISSDVESVYMPLALDLEKETVIKKGGVIMKPGVDQIPGTCMEYYISDSGVAYRTGQGSILISTPDTALLYMGEMKSHPIQLCDGEEDNNRRDVYSWIMNNTWETNFKMDLSGFDEFSYSLQWSDERDMDRAFRQMEEDETGIVTFAAGPASI